MQGGIGMAGNRISHLDEPEQSNDAVRLSYANEFYLKRGGTNWMRGPLHAGGFQVISRWEPPRRTRRDKFTNTSSFSNKSFRTSNHGSQHGSRRRGRGCNANILNRDIRTKSLNLDPQGKATKNFSMGEQFHIAGLPNPNF